MAAALECSHRTLTHVERVLSRTHAKRNNDLRISASECASLLGSNKYVSRESTIQKKAFQRRHPSPPSPKGGPKAVGHGIRYEDMAIQKYSELLMRDVRRVGYLVHEELEWLGARPDGITGQGECLEVKCPYSRRVTGAVPSMYYPQVQCELEVTGLEMAHYVEYLPKIDGREEALLVVPIARDKEWFRQNVDNLYAAYLDILARREAVDE
jgi:putative phage-type endonuclease